MGERKGRSNSAVIVESELIIPDVVAAWRDSRRYAVELPKSPVDVHHVYRFVGITRNRAKSFSRGVHHIPEAASPADVARYQKAHSCSAACRMVVPLIHPGYEDVLALATSFFAPFFTTRKTRLGLVRQRTVDALACIADEADPSVAARFFYTRLQFIEAFLPVCAAKDQSIYYL